MLAGRVRQSLTSQRMTCQTSEGELIFVSSIYKSVGSLFKNVQTGSTLIMESSLYAEASPFQMFVSDFKFRYKIKTKTGKSNSVKFLIDTL